VNETAWREEDPVGYTVALQLDQFGYPTDKTPRLYLETKEFKHRQAWTGDQHD